jgi:hypothetical protein
MHMGENIVISKFGCLYWKSAGLQIKTLEIMHIQFVVLFDFRGKFCKYSKVDMYAPKVDNTLHYFLDVVAIFFFNYNLGFSSDW